MGVIQGSVYLCVTDLYLFGVILTYCSDQQCVEIGESATSAQLFTVQIFYIVELFFSFLFVLFGFAFCIMKEHLKALFNSAFSGT